MASDGTIESRRRGKASGKRSGIYLRAKDGAPRADRIAALLFSDTVAARMLRMVLLLRNVGRITQAHFMREYHRRCARKHTRSVRFCATCDREILNDRCSYHPSASVGHREVVIKTAPSTYGTNFGRYSVRTSTASMVERVSPPDDDETRFGDHWCLWWYVPLEKNRVAVPHFVLKGRLERASIHWRGPAWPDLVRSLSDRMLHLAFEYVERQMSAPWTTDTPYDHVPWVQLLQIEIDRRSRNKERERHVCAACAAPMDCNDVEDGQRRCGVEPEEHMCDACVNLLGEIQKTAKREMGVPFSMPAKEILAAFRAEFRVFTGNARRRQFAQDDPPSALKRLVKLMVHG